MQCLPTASEKFISEICDKTNTSLLSIKLILKIMSRMKTQFISLLIALLAGLLPLYAQQMSISGIVTDKN